MKWLDLGNGYTLDPLKGAIRARTRTTQQNAAAIIMAGVGSIAAMNRAASNIAIALQISLISSYEPPFEVTRERSDYYSIV